MRETMLYVLNEQNFLKKKIAHQLHDDFMLLKQ